MIIIWICFLSSQFVLALEASQIEKEIRSLKPDLKNAEVTSAQLKSGEILAAAEAKSENKDDENNSLVVDFYFKAKNAESWTLLDHVDLEGAFFEFRKDGVLKISIEEGGTSNSLTTILWRLEGGSLKPIGQDTVINESWAINSKTDPFKTTLSTNFLTGKTNYTAEFSNGKVKRKKCAFNPADFKDQKLASMKNTGIDAPACPPEKAQLPKPADTGEIKKLNGQWKLVKMKCTEGLSAVPEGVQFADDLKSGKQSIFIVLNNGDANYEGVVPSSHSEVICNFKRTEKWSLKGKVLTVQNTIGTLSAEGAAKEQCASSRSIPTARKHTLSLIEKNQFELLLDSNFPTYCPSSNQKMTYERVN